MGDGTADDGPSDEQIASLIADARDALDGAHVPYSEYPVGAALLTATGEVFTGCNLEVANYSNSLHAEEVAIGEAVSRGHTAFAALAVVSGADDGVTPCGMCRQTLAEFCDGSLPVICVENGDRVTYTLGELLPAAISTDTLDDAS